MLNKDDKTTKEEQFILHLQGVPVDQPDPVIKDASRTVMELLDHPALYQAPALSKAKIAAFEARLQQVRLPVADMQVSASTKWHRKSALLVPFAACLLVCVVIFQPELQSTFQPSSAPTSTPIVSDFEKSRDIADSKIVRVKEPVNSARDLAQRLSSLGIEARLEQHDTSVVLEAYIAENQQQEVNRLLTAYQQRVGKNGELSIEFKVP